MPREARLFDAANGSPMRALARLEGNIPPSWIARARRSRKSLEPDLAAAMNKVRKIRKNRPKARATIKAAEQELRTQLKAWDVAYRKECFYNGLRTLLEISRSGQSRR